MEKLKYLFVYIVPLSTFYAFNATGLHTFLPIIIIFVALPLLEFFLPVDDANFDEKIESDKKNDSFYDWLLYLSVPIQLFTLGYFLVVMQQTPFGTLEFWNRIIAMGLMCGILGINVGHELGHRHNRLEQFLGEVLLLTSLNTHFMPFHNGGHHLNVATREDPATASKNEWLYTFWFTSHFGGYLQAWRLENRAMQHKGKSIFSLQNRMVSYSITNILLLVSIYFFFGKMTLLAFLLAAVIGIALLQTHPLGRVVLFNLSRHSDHHYNGSIKYQVLKSIPSSPQMPTGYPGMVVLAFFQPFWFLVMNRKLAELNEENPRENLNYEL